MQGLPFVGLGSVLLVQAVGQVVGALLLAALLGIFHRVYHRPYLRHWSRSWLALAVYLAAAAVSGLSLRAGSSRLHMSASIAEVVAGHLQIVWLVLGTSGLALGREVPRRVAVTALAAAALLGLGTVASGGVGGLSAFGVRCLVAGLAYFATAVALLWSGRASGGIGRRFMGVSLVAWAANQLTYAGLGFLPSSWQVGALTLLGSFDLLAQAAIGLALVTWLLEGEREDLARAVEVTQGQARVQACVYRISEAARSVGNLLDLFRSIHDAVSEVLPARNFYIALFDRTSGLLSFPYFVDERDPTPAPKPLGRGLTEYVLRTGRPLLATPEVFDALTAGGEVELIASNSVDWLGAPLVSGGETIGVAVIQTYDPVVRLGPEERDLFVFMTEQIAAAIEAKRAEEALRESEARLRLTIEQVPAVLWTTDDQLRFTSSLGAGLAALGLRPNQVVGQPLETYLGAGSSTGRSTLEHHRRALAGESVSFEHEQEGRLFTMHLEPLRDAASRVRGTIGIAADITEERRARDLVQSQSAYFRSLIENAHDGITVLDADGTIRFEAPSVERRLGYRSDEIVGLRAATLLHPDDAASLEVAREELFAGRLSLARRELRMRHKDGSWRVLETVARRFAGEDGRPYLILNSRDVTERKAAEEALRRAAKDESLTVLAGGVAHDFNNLLAAMLGHTSLALAKLGERSPVRRHLEKAAAAVERASALTRQMLAYSGRGHFIVRPTDLGVLVEENLPLLQVAIPKKVKLETRLGRGVPLVDADVGQMQQVVMNLVINAAEAIGDRGGAVTVATGLQQVRPGEGARWAVSGHPLPAGTYVKLEVADDGPGMDDETLGRIFEPFFSTKFTGRGLGLAAVLGVMRGHQGGLSVESEPGRGTSFRLLFAPSAAAASREAETAGQGGAERLTLLLIDDEEVVRDMVAEVLAHEGVDVLCAEDGARGIAVFRERGAEIDVVLLDLSMPGLSGEETFRRLCEIDPDVCVILSSGYDHVEATRRFGGRAPAGFIQKPYRPPQLLAEIERCHGHRAAGGGLPAARAAKEVLDAGGAES
jgi:two-component system cell cycle sensor histidine kinase/response regulator CckA